MGGCLALAALAFAPIARSQSNLPTQTQGSAMSSMETRSAFATSVENQLRQSGADVRVQLDGDRRDVLRVEWQGARRGDIFRFVTSDAANHASRMGFSSFVFTNGTQRWEYNVSRESMITSPAQL